MSANKNCTNHVLTTIYKRNLSNYESSDANMIRSISVYHCGGIEQPVKKYRKIYRNGCYKTRGSGKSRVRLSINECPIPRPVPYDKLMRYIKSIPVGNIYSVHDTLCDDLDEDVNEDVNANGCYRSLKELLLSLAEFYYTYLGKVVIPSLGSEKSISFM